MMLAVVLSYTAFMKLRYIPSIPNFIRAFIKKECWILLKVFIVLLRWWRDFCP
jgi:hypothetical protein